MNRWGGQECHLRAPLVVIHSSPLVHKNFHSIDTSKTKKANATYHKTGCIKHKVGHNRYLSGFHNEILHPSNRTSKENVNARRVLMEVVKPHFPCTNKTGVYLRRNKWTLVRLRALANSPDPATINR